MTNTNPQSVNSITDCSISGSGLTFSGFSSSVSSTIPLFNLTLTQTTVTKSSFYIKNYFPQLSNFIISYTTASMTGNTGVFDFRSLAPDKFVVIYVYETSATWNADGTGGSVLLMGGSVKQSFNKYSGLYLVNTYARRAQHILFHVDPFCSTTASCLVINNDVLTVDNATCVDCTAAIIRSDHVKYFITAANNAVVRFSNCTSTGGKSLLGSYSTTAFTFSSTANLIIYGISVDGPFLAAGTPPPQIAGLGYFSLMHINAESMQTTTTTFPTLSLAATM
ncbi:hypothetical protein STCU_11455 [Strigomonas culicis]|uniref:Uncharacterized protein n=1 Tax=Strigomonas culicis TaxID=28005 RepID=S9V0D6_9TRYP|nr:hypothetical protein STCU_11455 [Strigomonas culicis]|eukprot:EPY16240.1 hypothetical protein STCU_11455 [Strigomonas culicis]